MRIVLAFLLWSCVGLVAAQQPPQAVLVDEHGQMPCDDSLGRIDVWYAEISNNPGSTGVAVISTLPEHKLQGVFHQRLMEANARFRGADKSLTLKYLRATGTDSLMVQLWRVPKGGTEPEIGSVDNTFALPATIEPFLLAKEYPENPYMDFSCPGENSSRVVFAEFLKGNPSARGNIVVRARTIEKARRNSGMVRRDLLKSYGIPASRLRFFPRKSSAPANNLEPIVEYWYLP